MANNLFTKNKPTSFGPQTEAQAMTSVFSAPKISAAPAVPEFLSGSGAGSSLFGKKSPTVPAIKVLPPDQVSDRDRADLLFSVLPDDMASMGNKDQIVQALLAERDRQASQVGRDQSENNRKRGFFEQTARAYAANVAVKQVGNIILKPFGRKGAVNILPFPEVKLLRIDEALAKYAPDMLEEAKLRGKVQGVNDAAQITGMLGETILESAFVGGQVRHVLAATPVIQNLMKARDSAIIAKNTPLALKLYAQAEMLNNAASSIASFLTIGATNEQTKTRIVQNIVANGPATLLLYSNPWSIAAAPVATYLASRGAGLSNDEAMFNAAVEGGQAVAGYLGVRSGFKSAEKRAVYEHLKSLATEKTEQIHAFQQVYPDQFDDVIKMQKDAIKDLEMEHAKFLKETGVKAPTPSPTQASPDLGSDADVPLTAFDSQGEAARVRNLIPDVADDAVRSDLPRNLANDQLPGGGDDYLSYIKEKQSDARAGVRGNIFDRVGRFFGKVKSDLIDSNAPVEDAIAKAAKENGFQVLPKYDISNQIDRAIRSPTLANQFMDDHGLIQVIKDVDDPANLDQFLIAKQAQTVYKAKLAETGLSEAELPYNKVVGAARTMEGDRGLVRDLGPRYAQQEQIIRQYSEKLLEMMSTPIEKGGYGLISEETAAALKEKYPDYVPLNRVFADSEQGTDFANPRAMGSLSEQTVVKELKGSAREAESPMFSFLRKTYDTFSQGERNRAAYIISRYAEMPGMDRLVRPLAEGEHAVNKISFLDNGVERQFETTKEIAEAAKNMKVQHVSILGKIFGQLPVRIFKVGTTGLNLPFIGANIARDQVTAFVNSDEALATSIANPKVFVSALMEAVGHGDKYDDFIRAGAGGTSFDIARDQPEQTFEAIRSNRDAVSKARYLVTHPGAMLRATEDIFGRGEELTRMQQFIGTKKALLDAGRTEEDATILAAKAARENTANFFRKGNFGVVLNSTIPYFNAGIQGSRALVRSFARSPVETAAKASITVFLPMAVTTAWNLSDPVRKQAYDDIQDWEKKAAFIIVPPNPTKDERGRWNVIKIPLPPGLGDFASLIRRPIEDFAGSDPMTFMDVAQSIIGGVSPFNIESPGKFASGITPQVIRPTVESVTNTNLFTGAPQVSDKLARLPADQQVRPGTSGTVRIFSKPAGLSPIKTQAFLKGTFGGLSDHLLNISDNILAKFGYIPGEQVGGENVVNAMAARFSKASGGGDRNDLYDSFQKILGDQDVERLQRKDAAEILLESFKGKASFMQKAELNKLKKSDPSLYGTVKDIIDQDKKGLSEEDRLIMQLGVANGFRASYIKAKAADMSDEERQAYYSDLTQKKVITDDVKKQLGLKTGLFAPKGKRTYKSSLFAPR